MIGDDWVRSDPGHSGALGAWIALAVPLLELGVLLALSRLPSAGTRTPPPPGV